VLELLCREQGLGVINFFGLARGFIRGKYRSEADLAKSRRGPGVKGYLNPRGLGTPPGLISKPRISANWRSGSLTVQPRRQHQQQQQHSD